MKVAFVGKGGSGKTTLASTLARYLTASNFTTIAIDADINQHFGQSLGLSDLESKSIPAMGLEMDKIKTFFAGENKRITSIKHMIKTTPPGVGSRLMCVSEQNEFYTYFEKNVNGIRLLVVGSFTEDDLGVKCYHSKTGSVELVLNHLIDARHEYIIVDMTAGADSFASGLFTRFDITFLVVEPTIKSVSVYKQYKEYAEQYGVCIRVVGNKVHDKSDYAFIKSYVGDDLIATLSHSDYIRSMEKGEVSPITNMEKSNREALETIVDEIDSQEKDWEQYYQQAVDFHLRNAESWANASLGVDVRNQIDPTFSLNTQIKKHI